MVGVLFFKFVAVYGHGWLMFYRAGVFRFAPSRSLLPTRSLSK
jgi:hypothetical protein